MNVIDATGLYTLKWPFYDTEIIYIYTFSHKGMFPDLRERERDGGRERERHQCERALLMGASHSRPDWELNPQPGICPDWE